MRVGKKHNRNKTKNIPVEISFGFTMKLDKLWNSSQRGCGSYVLGDFQYLTGWVPEKPDLTLKAALL